MRGNDVIFAFPALLLAILITAVFGPGAVNAIIAIGMFNIPVFARVVRAGALTLWTRDYTLAARVAGKGRCENFGGAHPAQSRGSRWSSREPFSSRSASSRRRAFRTWDSERSRRRRAGAACSTRRNR